MMLVSKNEVTIRFTPGHDGHDFIRNAEKRGQKKFEVAVCIGVPPAVYVASQFEPRAGVYELEIAGGLAGEAVDVVEMPDHRFGSSGAGGNRSRRRVDDPG